MSDSVQPHRRQPTRLPHPWDSPGKNAGVGCHFLLQCMKVKSESEVAQSCPTLSDPMDCSLLGSSIHGIFQARVLEWGATAFSAYRHERDAKSDDHERRSRRMIHSFVEGIAMLSTPRFLSIFLEGCIPPCWGGEEAHSSHAKENESLLPPRG